ncbi:MAG: cobalamin-binding protein [Omnitrophica bacterium RIFCSPLOWO2_01_FULL_45_10b]|nr:MAG: cobalamin-binding protein [Omnitrophica bacterium RIFCSPLOWO2_01_FULL_45_10b]
MLGRNDSNPTKNQMRIVSLIPSATEIVCALGFESSLVGRSHECDYPETVKRLPACCEPKFDPKGTSLEIDQHVQTLVRESLSVYRVNAKKLKELKPDIIVTQDHCDVCAVSLEDVKRAVCEWLDSKSKIVTLRPDGLSDVWKGIGDVAEALGCPEKAKTLVQQYQNRMHAVSEKARRLGRSPSIVCIEWFDPLMSAANWMPEFVKMLGGVNLFGESGRHSPRIAWEDVRRKNPDIFVLMPCGWNIGHSLEEITTLTQKPGWDELKAVRNGQVYIAESNQYFNRPGPRLVESLEILAEIMYPDSFQLGYEGKGWQRFETEASKNS